MEVCWQADIEANYIRWLASRFPIGCPSSGSVVTMVLLQLILVEIAVTAQCVRMTAIRPVLELVQDVPLPQERLDFTTSFNDYSTGIMNCIDTNSSNLIAAKHS